jgi:hypothetical protein
MIYVGKALGRVGIIHGPAFDWCLDCRGSGVICGACSQNQMKCRCDEQRVIICPECKGTGQSSTVQGGGVQQRT